ncbi:transcriptional enhancer factor TEF-1-like isoform X2 [Rhopilema esculentum]|uniref:transcriptional enhancer factor TEF-1-like isoform X2 n=1 Tax=Rhopilema esculentum TaxID=499914 RepID=UPI0031E1843D
MADNGETSPQGSELSPSDPSQMANDAEGVWSPDIEQSFQEALAIYPPCGRRKIILSDEGKMYGRNELIARYIKLRTGKTRSRKQVSSHIQVLARRKDQGSKDKALQAMATMSSAQIVSATALHNKMGVNPGMDVPTIKSEMPQGLPPPSASIMAARATNPFLFWPPGSIPQTVGSPTLGYPYAGPAPFYPGPLVPVSAMSQGSPEPQSTSSITMSSHSSVLPSHEQMRSLGTSSGLSGSAIMVPGSPWHSRAPQPLPLRLVDFSAFVETQRADQPDNYHKHLFVHMNQPNFSDARMEPIDIRQIYDKFPEKKGGLKELYEKGPSNVFFLVKFWADLNTNISDDTGAFYGVSSTYESNENMTISCSTKVCSFGKQVVEKVETELARFENGRYVYRIHRSAMCEYMINFIHKLKHLPEKYMMNSVLENFTILQVVSKRDTQETLLCLSYVFEVSTSELGAQHLIYKLVKD